jgi:6-phosphogluconolactonase
MPARIDHPDIAWHSHATPESWAQGVADVLAALLAGATPPAPMRMLLSGGNTPAPVYAALAGRALPWSSIELGLVDERWLPGTTDNRNDSLVAQHLTAHQPAARLQPLAVDALGWQASAQAANARWQAGPVPAVAVLGMGGDSHTASLFPGSTGLASVLGDRQPYATLDATGCPGAQAWTQRITLTPSGLAAVGQRLLLLRGADKRDVLAAALASGDATRHPVLHALHPGSPLQVHWCA